MSHYRRKECEHALAVLEEYNSQLTKEDDEETKMYLEKVTEVFRSNLFGALIDIQEYYEEILHDVHQSPSQVEIEAAILAKKWTLETNDIEPTIDNNRQNETDSTVFSANDIIVNVVNPSVTSHEKENGIVESYSDETKNETSTFLTEDMSNVSIDDGDNKSPNSTVPHENDSVTDVQQTNVISTDGAEVDHSKDAVTGDNHTSKNDDKEEDDPSSFLTDSYENVNLEDVQKELEGE